MVNMMSISEKNPIRYFPEVDLEYPDELHCITHLLVVSSDALSNYCKNIAHKYKIKVGNG